METEEHRLMKEVVIRELRKLGYSDISTEEIIKNAYPRQFLSSLWFKELSRDSELSRVRKILGEPDKYGSKSSRPRVDIVVKENNRYLAFFEIERQFYPKFFHFEKKLKGLEVAAIKNDARLVFVVKSNRRSFYKLAGIILDAIWKVDLEEKRIAEKIGWDGRKEM
ncbi:MAG: hypothetical protein OCU16_05420 [Candidatus Methanospirare jalkutatii]|nr:hypothetical protein [Candidatus Methanospirare jalkutatii]